MSMAGLGLFVVAFFCKTVLSENLVTQQVNAVKYHPGDVRNCFDPKSRDIDVFEVLPGGGWDNLRNVPAGLIVSYNYSQCRTTHDRRFIVPDAINTIPLKQSKLEKFAEIIDHWLNYYSTTSHSVNVDAGLSKPNVNISGHFSSDYQHVKSNQINDRSVTTRIQLRYVRYTATLQPDSPLHPSFKHRLLEIAASLQMNETTRARYESQILIRDYGTHVISSVDAGAALVQEDQLDETFARKSDVTKSKIAAGASASFSCTVHFNASYTSAETKEFVKQYESKRTSSKVSTYGGPLFQAANYSANDWTAEVDKGLVAIDRSGDPLSFLITPTALPELPLSTLNDLQTSVANAIEIYYEHNTYRGCTTMDSPNFSPLANIDDGSCKQVLTNMTFGGVFQTCSEQPGSNDGNICSELELNQVNPKTGTYSCPTHYQQIKLHSASISRSRSQHSCHKCWVFFKCCHTDYYHSGATYNMYWCAPNGPVPQDSGYLFGGLFTKHMKNPLTGSLTCPESFYPRQLSTELFVCISDDFERGAKYAVPLAGFMSCQVGNPLALKGPQSTNSNTGTLNLTSFYRSAGPSDWPKHCPEGFSKYLAYMDQGCSINYCTRTGSLSGNWLPPVRRPPFLSAPKLIGIPDNYVIFDPTTQTWIKNKDADEYIKKNKATDNPPESNDRMTPGAAVGITMGVTLACIALTTVAIVLFRRRTGSRKYRSDERAFISGRSNYCSTDTKNDDVTVQVQT